MFLPVVSLFAYDVILNDVVIVRGCIDPRKFAVKTLQNINKLNVFMVIIGHSFRKKTLFFTP